MHPTPAAKPSHAPASARRRGWWFPAAAAAVVVIAIGAIVYATWLAARESTDDAFLDGDIVAVAPSVAGRVSKVLVTDNQRVNAGDLLVQIEPSTYQAVLAQKTGARSDADAAITGAQARLASAQAHVKALEAGVDQAKADARAADAQAARTAADLGRADNLVKVGAMTKQEFDQAKAAADVAAADREAAATKVAGAQAQADEGRTQVPLAQADLEAARAAAQEAAAAEKSAKIDVDDTQVRAPTAGFITRKSVEPGDYVQVGQDLFALVSPSLWVTANFKENQLARMKPGQRVEVGIDAEGKHTYRAHVDSVQSGSGARFSLFPPENATGNYVKIVQRVPVKIVFDEPLQSSITLGPGESVDPVVLTGSAGIPLLSTVVTILAAIAVIAGLRRVSHRPIKP